MVCIQSKGRNLKRFVLMPNKQQLSPQTHQTFILKVKKKIVFGNLEKKKKKKMEFEKIIKEIRGVLKKKTNEKKIKI